MSHSGQPVRVIGQPEPGWFLIERQYAPGEIKPRFLKDREYITASIYEDAQPDDRVILRAEVDGREFDPYALWEMRMWTITEAEYQRRRMSDG